MSIKIYHNPRCSKSRQAVQLLQDRGLDFEINLYLENGLSKNEILELLKKLNLEAVDIMRKKESEYKEMGLNKDSDLVGALVKCPKLLERPIVINQDKAAIGRPIDNIERLFN